MTSAFDQLSLEETVEKALQILKFNSKEASINLEKLLVLDQDSLLHNEM